MAFYQRWGFQTICLKPDLKKSLLNSLITFEHQHLNQKPNAQRQTFNII